MSQTKYVDIPAIAHVIGNMVRNPDLLMQEEKYHFIMDDFVDDFHQTIFGTLFNLRHLGVSNFDNLAIEDYLSSRPKRHAIYKANHGADYIQNCLEVSSAESFDYYYSRLKKMTLLRGYYQTTHMDLSWLYDPDNQMLDPVKRQKQEDWFDKTSLEDMANLIDDKILSVRMAYVDNNVNQGVQAGKDIRKLLEQLKTTPDIGYPMYGKFMTTITRGARLSKFYLRSAATGVGKTRAMIADTCYIGCKELFDLNTHKWISSGTPQKVLYIATEQKLDEVQTMMVAFLAGVEEGHILKNEYANGEWDRCMHAVELLEQSNIYFLEMPDFSLQDIENNIKREIREHGVQYVFLDYIHTSMKILEEVTRRSGGVKLREDNILFMISIRLKDIANLYNVFILSSTQLNSDYTTTTVFDQNLLRGKLLSRALIYLILFY